MKTAIGGKRDSNKCPMVEDVRPFLKRSMYIRVKHIAKPTYVIVANLHTILH